MHRSIGGQSCSSAVSLLKSVVCRASGLAGSWPFWWREVTSSRLPGCPGFGRQQVEVQGLGLSGRVRSYKLKASCVSGFWITAGWNPGGFQTFRPQTNKSIRHSSEKHRLNGVAVAQRCLHAQPLRITSARILSSKMASTFLVLFHEHI